MAELLLGGATAKAGWPIADLRWLMQKGGLYGGALSRPCTDTEVKWRCGATGESCLSGAVEVLRAKDGEGRYAR